VSKSCAIMHLTLIAIGKSLEPLKPQGETCLLYVRMQHVPQSKQSLPQLYKTKLLMSYNAKVTVLFFSLIRSFYHFELHTQHINAV